MNTKSKTTIPVFGSLYLIIGLFLSSCGPGQLLGPTLTPMPTNTPTRTITPTPTSTPIPKPKITAGDYTYEISKSGLSDGSVPDCDFPMDKCSIITRPGYTILYFGGTMVVGNKDDVWSSLLAMTETFVSDQVYLTDNDGVKIEFRVNENFVFDQLGTSFLVKVEVPSGKQSYTLYWPDTPPISIGE